MRLLAPVLLFCFVTPVEARAAIELQLVASGIPFLVGIENAGDDSGRLFLVSQTGRILIYDGTDLLPTAFLDISSLVHFESERGLLGLAFHPDYSQNGFFYVHYNDTAGDTVIARYRVSSDPDVADSGSAMVILSADQPFANTMAASCALGQTGFSTLRSATADQVETR